MPRRNSRGYTLIEMLIYVGLFAFVSVAVVGAILQFFLVFGKVSSRRATAAQATIALERIIREVRLGEHIDDASVLGVHPGTLTLVTLVNPNGTTITTRSFFLQGNDLMLQQGIAAAAPLTTGVKVTNLVFHNIGFLGGGLVYYVRKSGSDSNDCLSPATACLTIQGAVNKSDDDATATGDIIYVGAGTYNETVTLTVSGAINDPLFILADTNGSETGDAGTVTVDGATNGFVFPSTGSTIGIDNVVIEGFTITGSSSGIWAAHGSDFNKIRNNIITGNTTGITLTTSWGNGNYAHSQGWILEGNTITINTNGIHFANGMYTNTIVQYNTMYGNTRGIYATDGGNAGFGPADNMLIRHNTIHSNTEDGILGHTWFDGVIADNHIYNNSNHGIYYPYRSNSSLQPVTIRNNTINDNFDHGILFYTGMDENTVIENNSVTDQVVGISSRLPFGPLQLGNCAGVPIRNNDVWNNTSNYAGGCSDLTGTDGNISVNPLYVAAPATVRLQAVATGHAADSPAINTGYGDVSNSDLWKRSTRTDNITDTGIVDMGYHYGVGPTPTPSSKSLIGRTRAVRVEITIEAGGGKYATTETFYGTAVLRRSY
ncbi:MAG: hypothetical protein G01um101429_760 [Parcubacteria group bacterium Gr01-1014_29]|nr:MAG: hypothetical protein G01um101429_760 [Parcubacteria group bacterium Gr01-1014_29]